MCGGVGMQGIAKRLLPPCHLANSNPPVAEGDDACGWRGGIEAIAYEFFQAGVADAAQVGG